MHGFLGGWTILSMDTILWTLILLLFIYIHFVKQNYWLSPLILSLAILTRHEAVILIPFWLIDIIRLKIKYGCNRLLIYQICLVFVISIIYYGLRYAYYGTLIPHALLAKQLLISYRPMPLAALQWWGILAGVPIIVFILVLIKRQTTISWLVVGYIGLSFLTYIFSPSSDFARYSVHLWPLVIIFVAIGIFDWYRHWKIVIVILTTIQIIFSISEFRSDISMGAMHQDARRQVAQKYFRCVGNFWPILSSDLGMYGYILSDYTFIDIAGVTSRDVLAQYQQGNNIDEIILTKRPRYLIDSYIWQNDSLIFNRLLVEDMVLKHCKPSNLIKSMKAKICFKIDVGDFIRERSFGIAKIILKN
jgi:hypothetical protein